MLNISIHTFLAEGDLSLDGSDGMINISIHTFLAEGDEQEKKGDDRYDDFNPHLPCGR